MFGKKVFLFLQLYYTVAVFCYTKQEKPCQNTDDDCVAKSVANIFSAAINEDSSAGFEAIDPMHHDVIVATLPTVNFTLKDCTVLGLKELKIQSARVSHHDSLYVNITFPRFELSGMYEINGGFLNSTLTGNGRFTVKGNDIKVDLEGMFNYYKKNEIVSLKFTGFEFTTELVGKLQIDIENLFKGNKELADSALKLLNSNDKSVAALWNPPITRANLNKIFSNVNKLFEVYNIPVSDLVLEVPKLD